MLDHSVDIFVPFTPSFAEQNAIKDEMVNWCKETFGVPYNRWYVYNPVGYNGPTLLMYTGLFTKEEDAIAFKLRWS